MSTLTLTIVAVFCFGYFLIAIEGVTKINKAAIALLMMAVTWTLFMLDPAGYLSVTDGQAATAGADVIEGHLGSTATTLFFLMGAMTIVELIDQNGGFNFVRTTMQTHSKRALLWRMAFMTFFISAILDNLTTSIVMIMVLRKLVADPKDRLVYASLVIIAANSGGAFSPIGDVTTIMLWNKGVITALGVVARLLLPALVSMMVPAYLLSLTLKGGLTYDAGGTEAAVGESGLTERQRRIIFFLGVGGLISVPFFKGLTGLPPFVGLLFVLGLLWTVTEVFYADPQVKEEDGAMQKRVSEMLRRIDMSTILFFLGVLMSVACLQTVGVLTMLGEGLDTAFRGNCYITTGIIGILSSIVDNVPLVAGCMGMYPLAEAGNMAIDGSFWQLLSYCAGVGGSMLIIGSAAGVVVMGLEKITFGWYMKHISWLALAGYLAGMLCYWAEENFIF